MPLCQQRLMHWYKKYFEISKIKEQILLQLEVLRVDIEKKFLFYNVCIFHLIKEKKKVEKAHTSKVVFGKLAGILSLFYFSG
jgi:hypothetical protein